MTNIISHKDTYCLGEKPIDVFNKQKKWLFSSRANVVMDYTIKPGKQICISQYKSGTVNVSSDQLVKGLAVRH